MIHVIKKTGKKTPLPRNLIRKMKYLHQHYT